MARAEQKKGIMQQRHKNLDVSGRICITPNNKVFLGGHHHQAAAALACLIRVRKKTKTLKLFDHSHAFANTWVPVAPNNLALWEWGGTIIKALFGRSSSSSSSLGLLDSREEKDENSKTF